MQPTTEQLLGVIETQTRIVRMGLDLDGAMARVAEGALAVTGADGAAVEMVEGDELVYRAATGSIESHLGLRLPAATSLSGLCVAQGIPLASPDTADDPRVDAAAVKATNTRSMVVVPLGYGGSAVGVLKVMATRPEAFDASATAVLTLMADTIAAAMHHASRIEDDELFRRATRDGLTGLANRLLFWERLEARTSADREPLASQVVIADLDGMKEVNDTFGHLTGDAVLREVATRIVEAVRRGDLVARLGGDEFGVLLSGDDGADGVSSRIRASIDGVPLDAAPQAHVGVSLGVATFPADAKEPSELFAIADRAMYLDKAARNRGR